MHPNPQELVISDCEDCSDDGGICGNACDMLTLISVIKM